MGLLSENQNLQRFANALMIGLLFVVEVTAQRPRFPDYYPVAAPVQAPTYPPVVQDPAVLPGVVQPATMAPPPAQVIAPPFDPFQSAVQPLPFATPAASGAPVLPYGAATGYQAVPPLQPQGNRFPRTPQSGQFVQYLRDDWVPRVFERPRIRYTFLPGNNGNELQINDIEVATTFTLQSFLFFQQPIRFSPGFIAHFWGGPQTDGEFGTGWELPARAYSGYISLEHITDPCANFGMETDFTVGYYSDFQNGNSDSVRYTGVALGWFRLNRTNIFKIGVEYFDRVGLKLLPAIGLFIQPTPDLQIDLYFPRPRISQRIPSTCCRQLWSYMGAEIGGGSWTMDRDNGFGVFGDQVDINDTRVFLGLESVGQGGLYSFVEFGYVFSRELVSRVQMPSRQLDLQDTFMLRMGVAF